MSRIWNFSRSEGGNSGTDLLPARGPGQQLPPGGPTMPGGAVPGPGWVPEPEDDEDDDYTHYMTRPVRPIAQLAVRVALWGAVGLGALGGIVSLVGATTAEDEEPVAPEVDEEAGVPAPVAGTAELAVEQWLLATRDDADLLDDLFIDPPPLDRNDTDRLEVLNTQAVAGMRLREGYWTVTVAAAVEETPTPPVIPDDATAEERAAAEEAAQPRRSTWYVEVGIVGEIGDALKALTTPAIVPPPVLDEAEWLPSIEATQAPGPNDRIAATIEDFLNALLAGRGDPGRYLAHNVSIPAIDPPPFTKVSVLELSGVTLEDDDKADVRMWVLAEVETAAGSQHTVGYEIRLVENIDRWEIVSIWGAPEVRPAEADEAETESPPTSAGEPPETTATTGTTEPPADTTTTSVDPFAGEGGEVVTPPTTTPTGP